MRQEEINDLLSNVSDVVLYSKYGYSNYSEIRQRYLMALSEKKSIAMRVLNDTSLYEVN